MPAWQRELRELRGQMQARGRYGERTLRFHLGSAHDLDMMLLFGVRGTASRLAGYR